MSVNLEFITDQWIPALRSGEYKQGKGRLRSEDRFCCLGVACDLLIPVMGIAWEQQGTEFPKTFDGETAVLSPDIAHHIGIDPYGSFDEDGITMTYEEDDNNDLTTLNDSGYSFSDIADVLESYVQRKRADTNG